MKILVTGSSTYIGRNLILELESSSQIEILKYKNSTSLEDIEKCCQEADFVFHLLGMNLIKEENSYQDKNLQITLNLLDNLIKYNNKCPIVFLSLTHAKIDDKYGEALQAGEALLLNYGWENNVKVLIYRMPCIFGKFRRPSKNNPVANFCHNIANGTFPDIPNSEAKIRLAYIDDIIKEFLNALRGKENKVNFLCEIPKLYKITLGKLLDTIKYFESAQNILSEKSFNDELTKKLYVTYLSYRPKENLKYSLIMDMDYAGSLTEFLNVNEKGSIFIQKIKPKITRKNNWQRHINEKIVIASGEAYIKLKEVHNEDIIEFFVSGDKLEVIEIPTGYALSIENIGQSELIVISWLYNLKRSQNSES